MSRRAILLLAVLVAASPGAPCAQAQATTNYHVFGDVAMGNATVEGAVLHVSSPDGSFNLSATYNDTAMVDTPVGKMQLSDQPARGAGYLHFFVDVPEGRYIIDITSADGRSALADVTTAAGAGNATTLPWGNYTNVEVVGLMLGEPGTTTPVVVGSGGGGLPPFGGWHINGDVDLAGADANITMLRVTNANMSVDLLAAYGEEMKPTPYGSIGLGALQAENGTLTPGYAHYWFEVPQGTYAIVVSAGNMSARANVTTVQEGEPADFGNASYITQPVPVLRLAAAAGATTPTPSVTPPTTTPTVPITTPTLTPSVAPTVTPTTTPTTAPTATPSPEGGTPTEAAGEEEPVPSAGLGAAVLAVVALALARRRVG